MTFKDLVLSSLYPIIRSFLFKIDAEKSHDLMLFVLSKAAKNTTTNVLRILADRVPDMPCTFMGLKFRNPVGLAAGLDKDGLAIDGLAELGFGFIEVGTVTPHAQPGNISPRIFRLPKAGALINRMGFNNQGVDEFVKNVRAARYRGVLGLNIGKNIDTPIERAVDDYLYCLDRVYPFASYVTINISSPNTKNLRQLQYDETLNVLLASLKDKQKRLADLHRKFVPLALKISPDLSDEQIDKIAHLMLRHKIEAAIATNTTLSRSSIINGLQHANESGGLSGQPMFNMSNKVICKLRSVIDNTITIIGVGGIFSGDDALAKQTAGASLVQLYTGFIYRGPKLILECVKAMAGDKNVNNKRF